MRIISMTDCYVIEGVDFLPSHVQQLSDKYTVLAVFLGCSKMTLERFDQFPGHSHGYALLPQEMRNQIANDVPKWSKFIQQEAKRFNIPYIDTSIEFHARLTEAEKTLTTM